VNQNQTRLLDEIQLPHAMWFIYGTQRE